MSLIRVLLHFTQLLIATTVAMFVSLPFLFAMSKGAFPTYAYLLSVPLLAIFGVIVGFLSGAVAYERGKLREVGLYLPVLAFLASFLFAETLRDVGTILLFGLPYIISFGYSYRLGTRAKKEVGGK